MTKTDDLSRSVIIALATPLGFVAQEPRVVAPFTPKEWSTVYDWLNARGMAPVDLIDMASESNLLAGIDHSLSYRASRLLERLDQVRCAEDELAERGIWILTSRDNAYPGRWTTRLGGSAPPVLYGEGRAENLSHPSIGIVGSRDISESLADIANDLGAASVLGNYAVVSGGARGTDRIGMNGALEVGGTVLSIIPDHLQRERLRRPNRDEIRSAHLTMVSVVHPHTPFAVGNAMYRNRLIYALSDLTMVVSTSGEKGGTWAGATQNLKHRWTPLAVWTGADAPEANHKLVALGGLPFGCVPTSRGDMCSLVEAAVVHHEASTPRPSESTGVQLGLGLPDW
jgi:predicted Rossmann fold nucleotide-binding protein DprA/Smf involved in DNA uptake